VIVYAVVDLSLSSTSPFGDAVETFIRRRCRERGQSEHTSTKSKDSAPVIVATQARVVT
jgi:hypothetical protein